MPDWLPPLVLLEDYGGNWDDYLEAAYQIFCADFLGVRPDFDGKRMGLKQHPIELGKEATFWHFVQSGSIEADRLPEMRRFERIRWPRAVIDNHADGAIKRWSEIRNGTENIHLWCDEAEYLVVLADRDEFVLPWTAYPVERQHQKNKLNQRWEDFRIA